MTFPRSGRSRRARVVAACALALTLAACTATPEPDPAPPATTPTPPPVPIVSPLTGLEVDVLPDHPVLVVKIDNTAPAAPQQGLDRADLVVEEMVEGGVTRLAALYHSDLPEKVGAVRSARATDIGIASPADAKLVASGGARVTLRRIGDAGIQLFSHDRGDDGFWRGKEKRAPYNVFVDLTKVAAQAKESGEIEPYLTWADADTPASTSTTTVSAASVRFSPMHTTQWSFAADVWKRSNGRAGDKDFAAKNLVVVFADETDAGYRDPSGAPVPETKFDGSGRAVVFLGDQVIDGTWRKDGADAHLTLLDDAGAPIVLEPGKIWIELVSKSRGSIDY